MIHTYLLIKADSRKAYCVVEWDGETAFPAEVTEAVVAGHKVVHITTKTSIADVITFSEIV